MTRRRHFGLAVHATLEAGSGTIGGTELLSGINEHPWAAGCVVR